MIISGGQTGVDRAALEFAVEAGLPHGGWCPRDRWAEDGRIPGEFRLRETQSDDPAVRTMLNVMESDATLVVEREGCDSMGTALTKSFAELLDRPLLTLEDDGDTESMRERLRAWMKENAVRSLNVAGPRESETPGIGGFVKEILGGMTV